MLNSKKLLRHPKSKIQNRKSKIPSARRRLLLESLENRSLMAGDIDISISDAIAPEGVADLGNFVSAAGGLYNPNEMTYGPDGNLYVGTTIEWSNPSGPQRYGVLRFDGTTGAPLAAPGKSGAEFVSPGAGGLDGTRDLAFGPDGNLYVVSEYTNSVLRFDGATGDPAGTSGQPGDANFIAPGFGGLDQPRGILFHTDGYIYVTSVGLTSPGPGLDSVLRFTTTGAPAGTSGEPADAVFISSGSGGLDNPSEIVFENGKFYVASTRPATSNSVLEYSVDGEFIRDFVPTGSAGLAGPADIVFRDGYLYVSSWTNDKVLRYNGITGAFVDEVASGGGLDFPLGLLFDSNGDLLVSSRDTDEIRRYAVPSQAAFNVSLSSPSSLPVTLDYETADLSASDASDYTATSGTITFAPGQTSRRILVQAVNDAAIELNETFSVTLDNAVGGVITDGTGVGTIIDNDTKFYVVDDASANRTFEYGASGPAIENYALNAGNTAPRGAASTAVGDKVWVVDANRNVYIYGPSGNLLGSWSVGGFNASAQLEGIAVSGNDVWIVDNKSDKVYRFTGAATRLTGSQSAASSFALNSGNKDATDLVTDGASIWVLNNSTTDKVFKYTVSGTLLGSWTITSAGGSPTGITLDPSSPSHLWIVDSNSDRIYEFNSATSRTSGSQSPSASFPLSPNNTNPQGLADPPNVGHSGPERPAPRVDSASGAAQHHDLALLSLIQDLDDLLPTARRRK